MEKPAQNPFTLSFGEIPSVYVERVFDIDSLVADITSDTPVFRSYIVSGVRGSGKTVFLTSVMKRIEEEKDWIVIELNPEDDMREALAAKLYSNAKLKHLFIEKEFSFSFHGVSFSLKGKNPALNIDDLLNKMFASLKRNGKKVLVSVDEVSSNQNMKRFALSFQILIRQKYSLIFLGTGLLENVMELENEKDITFLQRSKKIQLSALSLSSIASSYMSTLNVSKEKADEFAKASKGYAFAFQLLGYLLFKSDDRSLNDEILNAYDSYLSSYVYDKIWMGCSSNDRKFLFSFSSNEEMATKDILLFSKMSKESFSTYRDRLLKRGLIYSTGWGKLILSLPRFREFMDNKLTFGF